MITPTEIIGLSLERTPLKQIIKQMQNPTRENIKKMYRDIGVDIFEGKDKITILSEQDYKKSKSITAKIKSWFSWGGKYDYEEKDTVKDLVHKYGCNNIRGTYDEIEEKFGQEGRRVAEIFRIIGYFRT